MKAASIRENLATLEADELCFEILAGIAPEQLEEIRQSVRTAWLPVELDVALSDAGRRVLGRERYWELGTRSVVRMTEQPLLAPVVRGFVRVWGRAPAAGFKLIPRALAQVYRNFGELDAEAEDNHARLTWRLPPEMMAAREYAIGTGVTFRALYEICGVEGDVDYRFTDDGHVLELRYEWR